ncbi:hypothetical protein DFA_01802 [Cavenderia fasciculata]|uniref:Uncharacterized protein n=1 Tax=Cavenderia fasciculata TaxID=261658 RepID=F4PUV4_CACFS|nr:uncharacterized protein DFA_01802 [Cavenderia fasciculata]EGG21916.1 hypothetical protein DFA_01802 [Cavenderia fasciculata]|eukprot:XP_004359767.1 hypothetical protein DFA_01802 [Cavenderia fasciculata]
MGRRDSSISGGSATTSTRVLTWSTTVYEDTVRSSSPCTNSGR